MTGNPNQGHSSKLSLALASAYSGQQMPGVEDRAVPTSPVTTQAWVCTCTMCIHRGARHGLQVPQLPGSCVWPRAARSPHSRRHAPGIQLCRQQLSSFILTVSSQQMNRRTTRLCLIMNLGLFPISCSTVLLLASVTPRESSRLLKHELGSEGHFP